MFQKQYGGGNWDEYCGLCMLPFKKSRWDEPELDKLRNVNLDWLEKGVGFDEKTKKIMNIGSYDDYGSFEIENVNGKQFRSNFALGRGENDEPNGPVFHKDCINCVEKILDKRMTYNDGAQIYKIVEDVRNDFCEQFYQWVEAVKSEGPTYFHSPMDKKGAKTRKRINSQLSGWLAKKKLAKRVSKKQSTGKKRSKRS